MMGVFDSFGWLLVWEDTLDFWHPSAWSLFPWKEVRLWGPWKHYIMQLPWKYHSPAATLFPWELGCLIFMEGKKSYGGSTSCVLRVPTRTVATVGQHICLHTPQLITQTWIIQFYFFLKMLVSCFPSNAGLCSLICSTSSSSSSSRVVLV